MTSTLISAYVGQGLAANRPVTPALATGTIGFWYSTDTGLLSFYANGAWQNAGNQTPQFHPGFSSLSNAANTYFKPPTSAVTTNNCVTGKLYAVPFYAPAAFTADKIGCYSNGSTSINIRLGVYTNTNGLPGTLIADAGSVASAGTGQRDITGLSLAIPAGWSWLAMMQDGTNSMTTLAQGNSLLEFFLGAGSLNSISAAGTGVSGTQTYGAMPATFPSTGLALEANAPLLHLHHA